MTTETLDNWDYEENAELVISIMNGNPLRGEFAREKDKSTEGMLHELEAEPISFDGLKKLEVNA